MAIYRRERVGRLKLVRVQLFILLESHQDKGGKLEAWRSSVHTKPEAYSSLPSIVTVFEGYE